MTPYITNILKVKLAELLADPVTRQHRHQIFKQVIRANMQKDTSFLC